MNVTIIGGTGFVGGYVVEALLDGGHRPALLVRSGSEAKLVAPTRCRTTRGDLRDKGAIREALQGCEALIYNVGLLREYPRRGVTFEEAHFSGVRRVAEIAQAAGVRRFVLMSANGVKAGGTPYQDTKYRAEQLLRQMDLDVTVFRPSVIFGDPRGAMEIATQLYQDLIRPPLPAAGFHRGLRPARGPLLMSPVHARDVADAFAAVLTSDATIGRTYALGGPEDLSWTEMLGRVAAAVGKRKLILPIPVEVMKLGATLFDWLPFFPVTHGQLTMLAEGNTAPPDDLAKLIGRPPRAFNAETLGYLRR